VQNVTMPAKTPTTALFQSFRPAISADDPHLSVLRKMIWVYFALLLAEGALRKWLLPSLTAPLLIIRDPLVLLIYVQAIRCRRFPVNGPIAAYFLLLSSFIVLAVVQIIAGIGGGPLIAAFGIRTNFLHLPLIFVIPQVFTYADVIKLGKWTLLLSLPMAALMIWQFMSPPDSWINAASTPDAQQIAFAMGTIRPAGTFTFITGASQFFILVSAFLIYGLAEPNSPYPRWLLLAALVAVLIVQPASGSRTMVLGCSLEAAAAVVFSVVNRGRAGRILVVAALICAAFVALSFTSFFQNAIELFLMRWNDPSGASATVALGTRILGGFTDSFALFTEAGMLGKGLGVGTNAGSALMIGTVRFLLAESEWSRIILEAGTILGFSFVAYRIWIAGDIALRAAAAAKQQHLLAWLLAWDACRNLITEQFSQPTNLGFVVFVSGLCLAAIPAARAVPVAPVGRRPGQRQSPAWPANAIAAGAATAVIQNPL